MAGLGLRDALLARPQMLGERIGHGADNALLLRHVAALMVIYGHAYALAGPAPDDGGDLLARVVPGFYAGSIGVCVFFALSGCLITRSWLLRPQLSRFAGARFLRIYPAFLACLLLTVIVLGPLFSNLAPVDYFAHAQTRSYVLRSVDLVGISYTLPEVFATNRVPQVVNGSLWSLALEVRLYLVIAILGTLRILVAPRLFLALVIAYAALNIAGWLDVAPDHQDKAALTLLFLFASLAAVHAKRVPLSTRGLLLMAALTWMVSDTFARVPMTMATLGYFSLWFCWRLPSWTLAWRGDYSYGLFLYGFPVQQVIAALWPTMTPLPMTLLAVPATVVLAMASWHWLEQPLLRLKQSRSLQPTSSATP